MMMLTPLGFADRPKLINGAGATFPYPIYSKWFSEYQKVNPSVNFNYQSIGSGGGIKQISARTVDFGASDAFLTNEQLKAAPGRLIHIPTVAGAVVVTYHLPGVSEKLKLTPDAISGIFLGEIKKWDDPAISGNNPDVSLPNADIIVVHRSDGSGTTNIFTDYLSSISSTWKRNVGKGTSVSWPVGLGGKGNEGVAGTIKQTPNSLGYVELAYAEKNHLAYAQVQNKSGNFITPSLESTTKAIQGKLDDMPGDFRVSLVNPDGPEAYPIAGFTWILIYQKQKDAQKGRAVVEFLKWAVRDGQKYANELLYASLPQEMAEKIDSKLEEIQIG
ncbi:MAG: phosphate ABC transporter substrate-binding protein PstS [Candidatus Omnitrophica bacterium]|nr:phosphate ABC transporter substrate-binding protein PstS [Candidatus Omnitrophota bacterium]